MPRGARQRTAIGNLGDHRVVITGDLAGMTRAEAQEAIEKAGGVAGKNMTKSTTILVVGTPTGAEAHAGVSNKLAKAQAFAEIGCPIKIITEEEFSTLLQAPTPSR